MCYKKKKHPTQTADNMSHFQKDLKVQPACLVQENNDRNQQTFKS